MIFSSLFSAAVTAFVLRSNNYPAVNTTITIGTYFSLNEMVALECPMLLDRNVPAAACTPEFGAKVVSQYGKRILSLDDVKGGDILHMVFAGTHFVYHQELGKEFTTDSGLRMVQLSYAPRVFDILDVLLNNSQISNIISGATPRMAPSTVGDTMQAARTYHRTSFNTVDNSSPEFANLSEVLHHLLVVDETPNLIEPMQIVRYLPGEFYLPHTDFFETSPHNIPTINNGSNRFATLFLYLNDVQDGGETMFPLAFEEHTHAWSVEKFKDECVPHANVLRRYPKKGRSILFYSQHPNGTLDRTSLHGACPPSGSVKWAANIWVWNRPNGPTEDTCPAEEAAASVRIEVTNIHSETLTLYWFEDNSKGCGENPQGKRVAINTFPGGHKMSLDTYMGHMFYFFNADDKPIYCFVVASSM